MLLFVIVCCGVRVFVDLSVFVCFSLFVVCVSLWLFVFVCLRVVV